MRYLISESPYIIGRFETGDTVTINIYLLSTGAAETLTSDTCSEIATTGIFSWSTSNLATQPTIKSEYLWEMTDGTYKQYGKIVLGGYVEDIPDVKAKTDQLNFTGDDVQSVASNMRGTDGANTVAPDNAGIADILADTNELQQNQGNWLTATGFATQNPPSQDLNDYKADVSFLIKIVKNRRILTKSGSTWRLVVYDDNDSTIILDKELKDKDGNDITDLDAGVLARELKTVA